MGEIKTMTRGDEKRIVEAGTQSEAEGLAVGFDYPDEKADASADDKADKKADDKKAPAKK